ncbi:MAG TPA: S-methyl-5-thioribose-1-phosphate isomerase [Candidatus Wallbacteria bacterium]|nr:S-methyl-5-thioribose-1-phosphate isomerase [Candidatus Wallbacteria bacterium]
MMEKSLLYNGPKKEIVFLDQLKLPLEQKYVTCKSFAGMCDAILSMKLRGAPLIGVSGAFGLLLWCLENRKKYKDNETGKFLAAFEKACHEMAHVRPTAVNLKWACDRVYRYAAGLKTSSVDKIIDSIEKLCVKMDADDISICEKIGMNGAKHIKAKHGKKLRILTHCNAGSLATCGYGTAVGVIRSAHAAGILSHVLVDETRPYLQGARITAYELSEDKIPYYLICDNMAGWLMKKGEVDVIITGADRIAANGDAANKIGTYSLSVLAHENGVPMYIAAPESTFDLTLKNGEGIKIEERNPAEVTHAHGVRIAPADARVKNPAFDVTPAKYLAGIITEHGVIEKPYVSNIKKILG